MTSLRRLILWTVALAVALVAGVNAASPTRAYADETSSVKGKLIFAQFDSSWRFDVRSEGHGDDAEGTAHWRDHASWATVDIECLAVDRTGTAVLAGVIVKSNDPIRATVGQGRLFALQAPDRLIATFNVPPTTGCSSPPHGKFLQATSGHLRIRGADMDDDDD
jgi:hypothetical protein